MTLIFYKLLAAFFIFLASIATVIYPLKKKAALKHTESLHLGEAIASGIFLGAAFFHMLPDAITLFDHSYGRLTYPVPEAICVLGFVLLLFLERLSLIVSAIQPKHSIPYILTLILIIHALIEGAALGIGSTLSETILLFIAIVAHKGSESFALCITMLKHRLPLRHIVFIIIFFSLMTPLGISLGAVLNHLAVAHNGALLAGIFNAFAAGTFLYISTLHHIHFHQHEDDARGLLEFACLVFGLILMGAIAWWA
ncbi:MAG: ZIP family metal transporter [Gammaproteobacteria bacterium]|nr:ZIP family metal transporter [Gammaproteobacteria bacterium]